MQNNSPSLDDFNDDAALGAAPRRRQRPRVAADTSLNGNRRPTPDSNGPRRPAQKPKKKKKGPNAIVRFFTDYRTHLAAGSMLFIISLVTAACAISFMFHADADQSVIHGRMPVEIVESGETVESLGGVLGAKLSEWLLVDTFGLASFVLVIYTLLLSLACLQVRKCHFFTLSFRCLFSTVALSIILGLFSFHSPTVFHYGGNHGQYINEIIYTYTDALGMCAVSAMLFCLLVAIFFNPIKALALRLAAVMPKRKKTVYDAATEDDAVADPISAFEAADDDVMEDDTDSESSNFTPGIADNTDDDPDDTEELPKGYERFMPAAIDDFASSDDTEPAESTQPAEISGSEAEAEEGTDSTPTSGPELVIVNNSIEDNTEPESEQSGTIRHGDHIGLDTPYDVRASHSSYQMPSTELLTERPKSFVVNKEEQEENKELIINALRSYNIEITRIEATIGPTVTLYEIVPTQGTRIAKIKSLEDDIAMSLSALGIRIIAPIPGKGTIGIEVPNGKPQIVSMRSVLESRKYRETKMNLPMALGSTISNEFFMADLTKLPHLLVAGATGQGKSVGLNCIITSLLYAKHPDELKFVLIDPKMVEFSLYQTIDRQYLAKLPEEENAVITDPQKVVATLNSLCVEMDQRYELLRQARVKSLEEYNERFSQRILNPELGHRFLPYIVMIVDEYADLVMTAGKDIAQPICRIAQKARAVGMHMIIATQRPSTDIITGMIKANFPARIAFKVTQGVDSKTILDRSGAQRLIGRGDMLTLINGTIERVQCALVETSEIEAVCQHIGSQSGFTSCYLLPEPPTEESAESSGADFSITDEFRRCAMFIASQNTASITMMQRKFEIGFNKAGRFMDQMEQLGIVGPANGAKPRQVLKTPAEVEQMFG